MKQEMFVCKLVMIVELNKLETKALQDCSIAAINIYSEDKLF